MMGNFDTLIFEKVDSIAYITLNRPEVLNAYNMRMRDELYQVLMAISDDPEVRVAVLKGAGDKAFCAGADLTEFLTAPSPTVARQVRWERDVWGLFLRCPCPLIAALHGYVLGSGIEMALCCDIRIASEDVQFGLPEVTLGIIPAAGATQTLPRVVGRAKALEMMFLGGRVGASEALDIGLVNGVVSRSKLYSTASDMARRISQFDPRVVAGIKQAVTRGLDLSLVEGLAIEKVLAGAIIDLKR
ncbi:MAG: enoyl-CoA hydratase/isomerase family protein [Chloroflexi bacterium]|nr:enoyl-CoA hydratase/isomerase family protein [Chloroflexota bacterium]